jgi:hypothetical protein
VSYKHRVTVVSAEGQPETHTDTYSGRPLVVYNGVAAGQHVQDSLFGFEMIE